MFDELIAPLFNTVWGRRIGWGLLAAFCLLLLVLLIGTLTDWYGDLIGIHKEPPVKTAFPSDDAMKSIAKVPDEHVFGWLGDQSNLPITSLQLHLVGVIKSVPEGSSRVIISEGGKTSKVYQVGDSLSSGVRVHEITTDGVVLENGGKLEKLPLQRISIQFQGMPKSLLSSDNAREE